MSHIFFHSAHAAAAHASDLLHALESILTQTDYMVWSPSDYPADPEMEKAIGRAIDTSSAAILFLTSSLFVSPSLEKVERIFSRFEGATAIGERRIHCVMDAPVERAALSHIRDEGERGRALAAYDRVCELPCLDVPGDEAAQAIARAVLALPPDSAGEGHPFMVDWPPRDSAMWRDVLQAVHRGLASGHVMLTGTGMTQLVAAYAHRYRFHHPGGVYWINAANGLQDEIATLVDRLGLIAPDSSALTGYLGQPRSEAEILRRYLRGRLPDGDVLIILDHVARLADMLNCEIGPKLTLLDLPARLLITTREPDTGAYSDRFTVMRIDLPAPPAPHREGLSSAARRLMALAAAFPEGAVVPLGRLRILSDLPHGQFDAALDTLRDEGLIGLLRDAIQLEASARRAIHEYIPDCDAVLAESAPRLAHTYLTPEGVTSAARGRGFGALVSDVRQTQAALAATSRESKTPHALEQFFQAEATHLRTAGTRSETIIQHLREHAILSALSDSGDQLDGAGGFVETCDDWLAAGGYPHVRTGVVCGVPIPNGERAQGRVIGLVADRMGKVVLSTADDGSLRLWDVRTGAERCRFAFGRGDILTLALVDPGDGAYRIIAGANSGAIMVVDVGDYAALDKPRLFAECESPVMAVAASPDGRYLASGGYAGIVHLWELETGREIRQFAGRTLKVRSLAFSDDGRVLLSGASDRTLRLWDTATGQELRRCEHRTGMINVVRLTRDQDDRLVALSASSDRTLRLWDMETGVETRRFQGHTASLWGAVVDAGLQYAFTISDDSTLRAWDVETGAILLTLHSDAIPSALAILPQTPSQPTIRLAMGDWLGRIRIMEFRPGGAQGAG